MTLNEVEKQDAELAVLVQKGDREAFNRLVERFQGRIFNFTYQFFRNMDIAAEMTQETFLRSYRFIKKYDPSKKFSTWLYSIAKNICIDEKRKMDRNRTVSIDDLPPGAISASREGGHLKDPCTMSLQFEDRMILEEAIAQLPEKYRMAIILCYFQELPYQEIADILNLNLNLVKVRIFRAKKKLLEILKDDDRELAITEDMDDEPDDE
jgi:RNA polymerase sigma-70 factor (ECF subfamily)